MAGLPDESPITQAERLLSRVLSGKDHGWRINSSWLLIDVSHEL